MLISTFFLTLTAELCGGTGGAVTAAVSHMVPFTFSLSAVQILAFK